MGWIGGEGWGKQGVNKGRGGEMGGGGRRGVGE